MELLWFSLKVMVIGMVVVFIGLIILIGAIKVLSAVMERIEGRKKAPGAAPAVPVPAAPAPAAAAPVAAPAQDDLALVAVIMAAILAGEQVGEGRTLVVRSVRRLGDNAWASAGRRQQLEV